MAPAVPPAHKRPPPRGGGGTAGTTAAAAAEAAAFSIPQSDSSKARLFLVVACLWPLFVLALFAASAPHVGAGPGVGLGVGPGAPGAGLLAEDPTTHHQMLRPGGPVLKVGDNSFFSVKSLLDRVDVMGYGPTHPRIAAVVVGDDRDHLVATVESVFHKTDLNRVFVVCVVVDGRDEDPALVRDLKKIDSGSIAHWHGMRPDLHTHEDGEGHGEEDDPHGNKVHVIFHPKKIGVGESRRDAVDFINILRKSHEEAGLKSPEEDLILLLLQGGAELTSTQWLPAVTDALIVPPPIIAENEYTVALKVANAVSFNVEGPGKRTSFDVTFTPVVSAPTADEVNESNGVSYPAPAFSGAAIAMRLETYSSLPSLDAALAEPWPANLDLALNLWLCGDGIDMIKDVDAIVTARQTPPAPMGPAMAARFAAAWMDDITAKKFFNSYTRVYKELTYYDWEKLLSKAREGSTFPRDLAKRCRSFQWLAENVNPEFAALLKESDVVPQPVVVLHNNNNKPDGVPAAPAAAVEAAEGVLALHNKTAPGGGDGNGNGGNGEDLSIPARPGDKKKPSKPLCKECLEIVQRAQPIDVSYVDVSGGHKEHPHLGAMDADGKLGYLHDETALRRNPPPFHFEGEALRNACTLRDNNYKMLTEKVFVDLNATKIIDASKAPRDKIFCLVYTIDSGHPKIPPIRETWGPKCDGFMVASNKTDPTIGAVNIPHRGEEDYNNIWQKVRSMWSYVYDNFYDKYDWFHIGGDDLYLIVENLRLYLESEEIRTAANGGIYLPDGTEKSQVPLFLGRRFAYQGDMNDIFNSGGSGYTMNKAALKTLVALGLPKFFPNAHTFSEDTMVARVFREFGVYPYETKDETGGERYMPFLPGHHYGYRLPKNPESDWYAKYSINIKEGPDHCAARSVAFHYVKGDMMKRLHALLYGYCPPDTLK